MADLEIRPIDGTEFPALFRALTENFGEDPRDADREHEGMVFEPTRSLAAFDVGRIVGTTAICSREMTVPGGHPTPIAGVTSVSVAPTHRRRGLLTELMRRQLAGLYEDQREPVAALWASEGGIYGRFGYGLAARRAALTADIRDLRIRPDVNLGHGRVRLAYAEEARPHLIGVWDRQRVREVGWLDRRDRWWDYRLYDPEHWRDGACALRFALYEEQDGQVTGYAIYRIKPRSLPGIAVHEVQVVELAATAPHAYAATWSFAANIDLTRTLTKLITPLDEPLQHLVTNPRAARLDVVDSIWVRLADVGRGLATRRYRTEVDIVLDVADEFCPWNAGRWRLAGGPEAAECARTDAPADLALTATDLGAAYLGGTTLANLAAAGRVAELRPGALAAAGRAFAGDCQPWCPEVF